MAKMYLDIETIPADESKKEDLLDIYTRKVEKSKKDIGTFEEYLETTNFDGSFGRICCISYAIDDGPTQSLSGDEKTMLTKFWEVARGINLFVGFNIIDFDLRFIYQRSIVHQIRPSQDLTFARYRNNPIYDVMREWSKWNMTSISLHALAKALGLKSSKEGDIEGKDVAQAYIDGRIVDICKYCEADVVLTREMYKRMQFESI
jgi:3'-5' exonuclease